MSECPECQRLRERLKKTEEALIDAANKILMVKRAILGNEERDEQTKSK